MAALTSLEQLPFLNQDISVPLQWGSRSSTAFPGSLTAWVLIFTMYARGVDPFIPPLCKHQGNPQTAIQFRVPEFQPQSSPPSRCLEAANGSRDWGSNWVWLLPPLHCDHPPLHVQHLCSVTVGGVLPYIHPSTHELDVGSCAPWCPAHLVNHKDAFSGRCDLLWSRG